MLQWTWGFRYLFKLMILFPLSEYPKLELTLSNGSSVLIFWGTFILFSIVTVSIYIPSTVQFFFPHPCQDLVCFVFLITVILRGMRCYHIVVLIFISLITDVEHLFMYLCVFFRKMYIQFLCSFLLRLLFKF